MEAAGIECFFIGAVYPVPLLRITFYCSDDIYKQRDVEETILLRIPIPLGSYFYHYFLYQLLKYIFLEYSSIQPFYLYKRNYNTAVRDVKKITCNVYISKFYN